ncbi:F-box domain-containing protein [Purpureocillium lilacinum]|uniref:F-box domain-containing protein n=1 Tax=Purpureocillium lilacinum TaxID=33203 RepID=A0A179H8Q4_PURLI|nr:F-box domain-containing protein [Purpureocillium lilacinum]OAQ86497.1 F-box domain-containing protein [Purpureocillium lilacinum]OAQ94460.1 F-box domain-containing protein [Purpureocillium lilacinum]
MPSPGILVPAHYILASFTDAPLSLTVFDLHPPVALASVHGFDWPMGHIPVEIFDIIVSHLPRSDVKTLRLVCREFEAKVSASYFRNVVVPFTAEIYSRPDNAFSSGMRIFRSFGPHVLRFALSLEVNEDALAAPPVKLTQRAIPTFWGIYRWPQENYCRYPDLEGIELAADETHDMAEAISCLSKVRNLGICCDAGLGFLLGPDRVAKGAFAAHGVFGTEDWRRRKVLQSPMPARLIVAINSLGRTAGPDAQAGAAFLRYETLARMMMAAGFSGTAQVDEAMRVMAATEDTTVEQIDLDGIPAAPRPPELEPDFLLTDDDTHQFLESRVSDREPRFLSPAALTVAQTEMLLELDWAHRAMIQSYVIALMDNARTGVLNNVTTLSIAKIPSSHIKILCRDDLWQSLPQLKIVSLGVIADWREICATEDGSAQGRSLSPTDAVGKVFELLNSHIGRQTNIESLHFEWICGGEFGPSRYQRNQYILPAPFFQQPENMARLNSPRIHADDILRLPHVVHLSLKNCWASPHVMIQALRQFALSSLEKLEFESVSLCGPPTTTSQPSLAWDLFHVRTFPHLGLFQAAPVQPASTNPSHAMFNTHAVPPPADSQNPLTSANPLPSQVLLDITGPGIFSWSGLIEYFSPGAKISQGPSEDADSSDDEGEVGELLPNRLLAYLRQDTLHRPAGERYQLRSISFKSCGYVSIDQPHIDTRSLVARRRQLLPNPHAQEAMYPSDHMQRCTDTLLGLIIPRLPAQDYINLHYGFGMTFGWQGIYDGRIIQDAVKDGIERPGVGRFSGILEGDGNVIE